MQLITDKRIQPTDVEYAAAARFQPFFASPRNSNYYLAKFEGNEQLDEIAGLLAELRQDVVAEGKLAVATGGVEVRRETDGDLEYISYSIMEISDYDFFE